MKRKYTDEQIQEIVEQWEASQNDILRYQQESVTTIQEEAPVKCGQTMDHKKITESSFGKQFIGIIIFLIMIGITISFPPIGIITIFVMWWALKYGHSTYNGYQCPRCYHSFGMTPELGPPIMLVRQV